MHDDMHSCSTCLLGIYIRLITINTVCRVRGVSLWETRSSPSARRFAECRNTGTRQRVSLPSAALGKGRICRVPNTRQRGTLGKRPLCRVSGTRRRITLGKIPQPTLVAPPSSFAECWPLALGKRSVFAECLAWHSAKRFLCRVPIPTLGKVFFFVFKFFLWHLYSTLKHMFQFGTFL